MTRMAANPATGRSFAIAARPARNPWLARTADAVLTWYERARQRRRLAGFDDRLLHDLGISRADALSEAEKPFWRA